MNRDQYIGKHWKKYPKVTRSRAQFIYGRVHEIRSEIVKIKSSNIFVECVGLEITNEDQEFGINIPSSLLTSGDVVAYDENEKLFYLLSPQLKKCNIKLESEYQGWNLFLSEVEKYFVEEEFFQARTPFLVSSPGVDHHIHFLEVNATQTKRKWCLPTSPEIHLKKLLCSGFEKIFEIKSCFRDDLEGPHHKVEFTMLEWYRSFVPLDELVNDLENLISRLFKNKTGIKRIKLSDRFFEMTNFKLEPSTTVEELKALAHTLKIETSDSDDWNDIFFRIYIEKIEPSLGLKQPEAIFDFPVQQASLAQINKEGWAERFELYWKGVELANAYCEVNDPDENQIRFKHEKSKRVEAGFNDSPLDSDFFEHLNMGMPPSCGVALGLDRLYMLAQGNQSI